MLIGYILILDKMSEINSSASVIGKPIETAGPVSNPVRPVVAAVVRPATTVHLGTSIQPGTAIQLGTSLRPGTTLQLGTAVRPGTTVQLGTPLRPGTTVQLGTPLRPGTTVQLGTAVRPGTTVQLGTALRPGTPVQLGTAVRPITTVQLGTAVRPGTTVQLGNAVRSGMPVQVGTGATTVQLASSGLASKGPFILYRDAATGKTVLIPQQMASMTSVNNNKTVIQLPSTASIQVIRTNAASNTNTNTVNTNAGSVRLANPTAAGPARFQLVSSSGLVLKLPPSSVSGTSTSASVGVPAPAAAAGVKLVPLRAPSGKLPIPASSSAAACGNEKLVLVQHGPNLVLQSSAVRPSAGTSTSSSQLVSNFFSNY